MVETSAHLVDHVFPEVPVRQWVLSFPYPLRFLFASRPAALPRCLAVILRAIETDLIQRADLTRASGARTGAVTVVQRFGSALNLNVHLHMLIRDGVYTCERGTVRFHEVGAPPPGSLERLTAQIVRRVYRRLVVDGWLIEDPEQPWLDLEETDALDPLRAESIRYRVAFGPSAGRRTSTLVDPSRARPAMVKPFSVNQDGFSLNAAVASPADSRVTARAALPLRHTPGDRARAAVPESPRRGPARPEASVPGRDDPPEVHAGGLPGAAGGAGSAAAGESDSVPRGVRASAPVAQPDHGHGA